MRLSAFCFSLLVFVLAMHSVEASEPLCGDASKACEVELGSYHIAPATNRKSEKVPALLFFHGAGGSGKRIFGNGELSGTFTERGYSVIGLNGLKRPNSRFGPGWSFHPDRPKQRDELLFARQVIEDVVKRHDVDPERILIGGFSIGASLTWYLACSDPDLGAAFVPVGGAFWRPHPPLEACSGKMKMFHTHGWRDTVVPLEGRVLGNGRILQGDVFYSLQVARKVNRCDNMRAERFSTSGKLWRRGWDACAADSALEFAIHPGAHSIPSGWADMIINWFEALPADS